VCPPEVYTSFNRGARWRRAWWTRRKAI
jgi:hypothetical protein